jgi:hypothetical protein
MVYGYVVYRSAMAREIGIKPRELDRRVGAILERILAGLEARRGG